MATAKSVPRIIPDILLVKSVIGSVVSVSHKIFVVVILVCSYNIASVVIAFYDFRYPGFFGKFAGEALLYARYLPVCIKANYTVSQSVLCAIIAGEPAFFFCNDSLVNMNCPFPCSVSLGMFIGEKVVR